MKGGRSARYRTLDSGVPNRLFLRRQLFKSVRLFETSYRTICCGKPIMIFPNGPTTPSNLRVRNQTRGLLSQDLTGAFWGASESEYKSIVLNY